MNDSWDEYAKDWDNNKDVILYSEEAFKSLSRVVELDGLNILDFGCGTGLLSEKLSPFAKQIVALDASQKMIQVLDSKRLPNVTTITEILSEDSVSKNKCLQEKFDVIVASSVCGFLPDYESTLSFLRSILVTDGLFVQWDWLALEENTGFGLSKERVEAAFKGAGFSAISITQPFSMTNAEGGMPVLMVVAKNALQ